MIVFVCTAVLLVSCGSEDKEKTKYDPDQPSRISTFYPSEGKYQEKIMLTGVNLPTDPSLVRVYFNNRRAPMIGGTTERMYVLAPRLPGNAEGYDAPGTGIGHCIISVVIAGQDSTTYPDTFLYEESITVSTVAGNGDQEHFEEGNLANAILQPKYIACDNDGNVFISNWRADDGRGFCYICRLNEEENSFTRLRSTAKESNVPCVDPVTGVVTIPIETMGSFISANPNEYWAPRDRDMKFQNWTPPNGWKHAMVVNPTDGMIYTRWYQGSIVRIDPNTYETYRIAESEQGDSYGLTFRPQEPNIMYISFRNNAGIYANSIATVDVSAGKDLEEDDPAAAKLAVEATLRRVSSPSTGGGHRDGPLATAQFRNLGQIFCDQDGFIYVADRENHCIRRITPENQVETVLGIPGTPGWRDGTRDEALFRNPTGIAIASDGSVYIADNGNSRLRKLSVN
ncbi:MAG: IPT/TIG domain-containing protein [Bacteroidales bacterium]|jgi:streptogramin lyase|nr:IPT/TIG domain-containing protein [Bacteroidales bacterium]